jgi:hypothetical protein
MRRTHFVDKGGNDRKIKQIGVVPDSSRIAGYFSRAYGMNFISMRRERTYAVVSDKPAGTGE